MDDLNPDEAAVHGQPIEMLPRGLLYVADTAPGIRRIGESDRFAYEAADGTPVRDAATLERIAKLAIPPAYVKVWICPSARGHLQATGRDAKGRKQYRYHADWMQARGETKFDRLAAFGAALPRIRARVKCDLASPVGRRVLRDTVIAAVVRLLDTTAMRIGNDEYARINKSFGLTTLRHRHVAVKGDDIALRFRGKSGVVHDVALHDSRVARVVRRCQALPGQELFHYLDADGQAHTIGSADVNEYICEVSGGHFTAKDFRTWHGSVHALQLWRELDPDEAGRPTLAGTKRLLTEVAKRLGNTVAVCRKAYVHPHVLALMTGQTTPPDTITPARRVGLSLPERELLAVLPVRRRTRSSKKA